MDFMYDWRYLWMGFGFLLSTFLVLRVVDSNMRISQLISDYYAVKSIIVKSIIIVNSLTLIANATIWGFLLLGWGVLSAFGLNLICEYILVRYLITKDPKLFEQVKDSLFNSVESEK